MDFGGEEDNVAKLARAFFLAATKESADDEDILPQVDSYISELIPSALLLLLEHQPRVPQS